MDGMHALFSSIREVNYAGMFDHLAARRGLPAVTPADLCVFDDVKVLANRDLISTFLVLVVGVGVSALALTFELLSLRGVKPLKVNRVAEMQKESKADFERKRELVM